MIYNSHRLDVPPRNIHGIHQNKNGQKGNYYKFVVYNKKSSIVKSLPILKTKTSAVYDYCLCECDNVIMNHACLPIWYGQEQSVTDKVLNELSMTG